MEVIKRNGHTQEYDSQKIACAIQKSFEALGHQICPQNIREIIDAVEKELLKNSQPSVEEIQDLVERALMESGFYEEAKCYILYRQKRSEQRAARKKLIEYTSDENLDAFFLKIEKDFTQDLYPLSALSAKLLGFYKPNMSEKEYHHALIKAATELVAPEVPKWEFIAARILRYTFQRELDQQLQQHRITNFYEKIRYLTDVGLYGSYILEAYSRSEIDLAASFIQNDRDNLFTYSGLDLLLERYVIHDRKHIALETPQEMFLGIALHLAMGEKHGRMEWVRRFYDMLSSLEVTMATPTMSNARKPYHQLSSCFVDVVPDSLTGIYRSIDNFAQVSKFGGGMGMYLGKVRATGGSIRGFEGAAGGVNRWIKLINDTAVAVDQLGMRQGAVAVYLDVWHKDLLEFLQLRTNNGDDRIKAHDVFPGICYPDLFWRTAKDNMDAPWYMMCPHDIVVTKGYALEDYFGAEWENRYWECVADARIPKRSAPIREIIRLILKSAVETGTPFAFYRDTVNKFNPNAHQGVIYCSNLCTEIAQNMAPIEQVSTQVHTQCGETVVVTTTRPGDFVVCNLASLSLGKLPVEDEAYMRRTIETVVRALDNVIDLNFYPLEYAKLTNQKYRGIGLGVSGYHQMLAARGIPWESQTHLCFVDEIFEKINYAAITASMKLSKEKGPYQLFQGSDWQTGIYFSKRRYSSPEWKTLAKDVRENGMRNAYLLAVAPTSSTSILSGTTAGVDPLMNRFFLEEKRGSMLPRIAPELSPSTYWYYKSAHQIDQTWSVKAAGVRQRHIDQSQSMNLYITNNYTLRQVMNLYLLAWECGAKTVYYVRSKALEVDECESCTT